MKPMLELYLQKKLRISPEGIEWKGRRWDLDSITRVRWGATQHSVNGVSCGTTYKIVIGNNSNSESIILDQQIIYNNFIERLWKVIGIRLLTECLEGLRLGKKYHFGSAIISDHGMDLKHESFWGGKEQFFCPWNELLIWNDAGFFCIGKKNNKRLTVSLSYQDDDNTHILEAAIRMFWKRGGDRLSSLLEENVE
jgi:hypothetical protein